MATRLIGTSAGDGPGDVAETSGSATATDSMEFTYDLAVITSREQVILGLTRIMEKFMRSNWPPA